MTENLLCGRHLASCLSTNEENEEVKSLLEHLESRAAGTFTRIHAALVTLQTPQLCPPFCSVSRGADFCGGFTLLLGSAKKKLWREAREGGERGQSIQSLCSSRLATVQALLALGTPLLQVGNCFQPLRCWSGRRSSPSVGSLHLPIMSFISLQPLTLNGPISAGIPAETKLDLLPPYYHVPHLYWDAPHSPIPTHLRQEGNLAKSASWLSLLPPCRVSRTSCLSGLVLL